MARQALFVLASLAGAALAGPVLADPCRLIPDRGPAPAETRAGREVAGPVVYVGDGDSLCLALGRRGDRARWLEIRLADFDAPELAEPDGRDARERLRRLTLGRRLVCRLRHRSWDRAVADCALDGRPLGDRLRADGGREGGR